ncbi:impB/mucB/samB family protein [Pseudovirgaria hyperparasitica]|uniref:DNA polymerase eta n=1 Tax=Pseudovirgaria hyperparasitica TaxID=470096 RepID=A0A6A6W829_9PEZI|nr:impB/mucB/samB family protein [Pseudovirgaria hyperparasitica]KAF2759048.1 impB/mucB/samB family protein [Pseudovirgaria hyperparasitica]
MSSSQPYQSSPLTSTGRTRKSVFTFRHLNQLALSSTACPLRVIAHIDLDAFYAQCEMVRLGIPEDQPLAVQQWQGLIAINYPAREYGLNRHITMTEAKKLCPDLIMQHVATWKEGDEKWAYHEEAFKHIATHKVSLDPYRMESRRILQTIKDALPGSPVQRVEKASVDEVFLDLSAQIHGILLERYPELEGPPPYDDPTEHLPQPPTTALDWNTDALVDLDDAETEEEDPDWDDICLLIGSEIVRSVRAAIRQKLHYTCSAGLSRNKMLAKLGSAHKKPNQQTIIRNRAVQQFLSGFKFTKIRNLGGKLGDETVAMFQTDMVKDLLDVSLEQLKRLGDDTGTWLYSVIRGEDYSEVNPRTQIKSMLSAKSFRPSINNFEQGVRWLRIFVADIFSRCVEEGVLENKRRPKTINLHHRTGAQTRSKQAPIPLGKPISEEVLFNLGKHLFAQIVADGRAWPCANLSLSVAGFEDGVTNNHGIGNFLVRGEEAKAMNDSERQNLRGRHLVAPSKRRKTEDVSGKIQDFFHGHGRHDAHPEIAHSSGDEDRHELGDSDLDGYESEAAHQGYIRGITQGDEAHPTSAITLPTLSKQECSPTHESRCRQQSSNTILCTRCSVRLPADGQAEHEDWHMAKDLSEQIRQEDRVTQKSSSHPGKSSLAKTKTRGRPTNSTKSGRLKGQLKLAFGKG